MGILDFFKPVENVSPDEVKKLVAEENPEGYNLLDVRQKSEYEEGHLPGAELISLSELAVRHGELNHDKPTIVYCQSGNRSRSAVGLLMGLSFKKVLNMEGGILAYNGITASGGPEAGLFCFPDTLGPGELSAVACYLEGNTISFLDGVKSSIGDTDGIIAELREAKTEHRKTLGKLYSKLTGKDCGPDFPKGVIETPPEDVMVGCVKVSAAIEWAKGKKPSDVLELMLSLEANALDLYLKLHRMVKSDEARSVFGVLAEEQQRRVERAAEAFEESLSKNMEGTS